jgi:MFS family permease
MQLPTALRALGHRNYSLFFAGQLISLIGTWMQSVGEMWLVYRLTHSSLLLGTAGFFSQIPVFLLAPFGGMLADTRDRRKILVATQSSAMVLAGILAVLTLTGVVRVWHVFTLAALLGVVNAADIPTRQAFVADLVARDDLMNAIALNSSMFNGARVVGPAVAGILIASIGEGWCFFANSASYIAVITGLLMMSFGSQRQRKLQMEISAFEHIAEGFRFVFSTPPIRALMMLLGAVSLFGISYAVLMPVFADQILHVGAHGLGILMGFSGGGALLGAIALAMKKRVQGLGRWVTVSAAMFGVALMAFSFSQHFWLSCLLIFCAGFFMMVQMSSSNTLIQSMVPDRLRGRVMAVYSMMFMGMAPLGSILAGGVAERLKAPLTVAGGAGLCVVAAGVFGHFLPQIRPHARELIIAQQMQAAVPAEPNNARLTGG